MSECKFCSEIIGWAESKEGNPYPINPGKVFGDPLYFHSKTCKKGKSEEVQKDSSFKKASTDYTELMWKCLEDATKMAEKLTGHVTFTGEDVQKIAVTLFLTKKEER